MSWVLFWVTGVTEENRPVAQNSEQFIPLYLLPYLTLPPSFPFSLVLTGLGVLRMLPVLQRLGDAYGF